jgi:hypothetical protein
MKAVLLALAIVVIGGVVFAITRGTPPESPDIATLGREAPDERSLLVNGFRIPADRGLRAFYERHQVLLGEPVSAYTTTGCQSFRFARVCHFPGAPQGWEWQLENLGELDMRSHGYEPSEGHSPHAAIRDWLATQIGKGLDSTRFVGPAIGPPVCLKSEGTSDRTCYQWTAKARFEFPEKAGSGDTVRRAPIGLYIENPSARDGANKTESRKDAEAGPGHVPWIWMAVGVVSLAAVALLLRGGARGLPGVPPTFS